MWKDTKRVLKTLPVTMSLRARWWPTAVIVLSAVVAIVALVVWSRHQP
jgi:hypothetical protein